MRIKFKIPFKSKKVSTIPTEEDIVNARERMDEYPLLATSVRMQTLATNKFITEKGVQLHPTKFLNEVTSYIEKTDLKTKEDFIIYIEQKISAIVAPPKLKKKGFFSFLRRRKAPIPE